MDQNIEMIRGDTLPFAVQLDGLDQDLDSAFFSVKKDIRSSEYSLQKSLGNGITKAETNKYRVRVAPEDTANLETGEYYYDLQIGVNGDIFTLLRGILFLEADVTRGNGQTSGGGVTSFGDFTFDLTKIRCKNGVRVLMLKGEKGDKGDPGEPPVITSADIDEIIAKIN